MAMKAAAEAELCRLRQDIARIEGRPPSADRLVLDSGDVSAGEASSDNRLRADPGALSPLNLKPHPRRRRLRLAIPSLDAVLGGGLPLATLHEIRAAESRDGGAASGFVLALAARLVEAGNASSILWIGEADTRRETGRLYAPGLIRLGLDPASIVEVAVRTQKEALWAFETALSCRGVGAAVCELREASLDLSATRRCALRARAAGVTGFLLRLGGNAEASAAELRFRIAALPAGAIGRFPAGIGRMAWRVMLEKNRGGPTGAFALEWNAYERAFAERSEGKRRAHPQPHPAAPFDRPASAAGAETVPDFRRVS